jgi:endonuclease/exonuclease/phosphatase family metal-dependent hydrolase
MILLSLNIRGVGGHLKAASFRRLLSHISPDIIFLQETLVDNKKARVFLNQFHSNWNTCTVNSLGSSGGLAVAWNPDYFDFLPYLCCGGILLTGTSRITNKRYNLLNIYGPCSDRQQFWEKIEARGLLDLQNLIIAGDLNLTTALGEVWGASATPDTLALYFNTLFSAHHLVDFAPASLSPTWRNGREGTTSISKRLDHFILSEHLISSEDRIRTWVSYPYLSDHAPIALHLEYNSLQDCLSFQAQCRLAT